MPPGRAWQAGSGGVSVAGGASVAGCLVGVCEPGAPTVDVGLCGPGKPSHIGPPAGAHRPPSVAALPRSPSSPAGRGMPGRRVPGRGGPGGGPSRGGPGGGPSRGGPGADRRVADRGRTVAWRAVACRAGRVPGLAVAAVARRAAAWQAAARRTSRRWSMRVRKTVPYRTTNRGASTTVCGNTPALRSRVLIQRPKGVVGNGAIRHPAASPSAGGGGGGNDQWRESATLP
jgi:hypothetical protein